MKTLRAEAWTTSARTSVVMDDETTITGKRVVAECDDERNAALMASAPELLEALQEIVEAQKGGYLGWSHIDAASAAIAKATGK